MEIDDRMARLYASWFRCLADASRLRILNLLADSSRPMSIRELVDELDIGQPTVSHHVKELEAVGFVTCRRKGGGTLVRVNRRCLRAFPSAAAVVMGQVPATARPWAGEAA